MKYSVVREDSICGINVLDESRSIQEKKINIINLLHFLRIFLVYFNKNLLFYINILHIQFFALHKNFDTFIRFFLSQQIFHYCINNIYYIITNECYYCCMEKFKLLFVVSKIRHESMSYFKRNWRLWYKIFKYNIQMSTANRKLDFRHI